MGLSCGLVIEKLGLKASGLLTISLHTDYIRSARIGAWLVADTDVLKCGKSVCFARALVKADEKIIATVNATYKVIN